MSLPARSNLRLRDLIAVVGIMVLTLNVARVTQQRSVSRGNQPAASEQTARAEPALSGIEETAQPLDARDKQLVGVWQQEKYGRRTLTILPEGKAKMTIEPAGAWSLAFGKRLDAEMYWSLEGDRIIYGMTSGTPANKYEIAVKAWGDRWNEQLTALTAERLTITADDGTVSVWQRVDRDPE